MMIYFYICEAMIFGCLMAVCDASNHRRLRDYLMQDYGDVHIRPVKETTTPTIVTIRPLFNNLIDMDTINQQFTMDTWMKLVWTDEFLTWDPSEFNGTSKIYLTPESVWKPDFTFLENVNEEFQREKPNTIIEVHSNGAVRWFLPMVLFSWCPIRVTWYPYDIQVCDMTFGSFGYTGYEVVMTPEYSNDTDQNRYLENGVWDMVATNMKQLTTLYSCCDVPFYEARYRLIFRRQPGFYVNYLIVPVVVLSLLSLLVFYLPPDCGEKLTLSITNLLAVVVFQQLIAAMIPPSGQESPIIGKYFLSMIIMVSASVVATVLVIHINAVTYKPVPRWLRWMVLEKLPQFICLDISKSRDRQVHTSKQDNSMMLQHSAGNHGNDYNSNENSQTPTTGPGNVSKQINGNNADWKLVAIVVDRCLLVVFFVITFTVTTTILAIIVTGSKNEFESEINILYNEWANETVRTL